MKINTMVNIVSVLEMRPYIIGRHLNNDEDLRTLQTRRRHV
jgi:hypothetical protein